MLDHPEGREILLASGAKVRHGRILLDPELVEQAVSGCPAQVTIRGRREKPATLDDGSLHWHNLGGAWEIYDKHIFSHECA